MVDREQIRQQLMQTFLEELEEHARNLNRLLLELEKCADPARRSAILREIFRAAHSLKGDARVVGLPLLESVCHEVESDLSARTNHLAADTAVPLDAFFEFADALQEAASRLRSNQDLADSRLSRWASRPGTGDAPPEPAAPAEPAPERPATPVPERAGNVASVRLSSQKLDALLLGLAELQSLRLRPQTRREQLESLWDLARDVREQLNQLVAPRASRRSASLVATARAEREFLDGAEVNQLRRGIIQIEKELQELHHALAGDELALSRSLTLLENEVRSARLVPFAEALAGHERIVRDLAQQLGKSATFVAEGEQLELDRHIIQSLREPLQHLLRNAVDHGLETPAERVRVGKPESGTIVCSARIAGDRVVVEVRDDGRGIDWNAVRERARQRGIPHVDQLEPSELLFRGGITTATEVTHVSGRGIGLDVVRARVEALRGELEAVSDADAGTRFIMTLPVDVSRRRVLLVRVAGQVMALDHTHIVHVDRLDANRRRRAGGQAALAWGDWLLPLANLSEVLNMTALEVPGGVAAPVVIVQWGKRQRAFVVEGVEGSVDTTVQALGPRLRRLPFVQGTIVLADGSLVLMLDAAQLVEQFAAAAAASRSLAEPPPAAQPRRRLLVADDSLTTRTLEKTILEAAGFEVLTAVDGQQAWQLLQERGADLLITDVEMPSLNGFELTQAIRASKRFRDLPIILLTARHSEHDQQRGLEAGADAYMIKSAFDQRLLLATIEQLL